MTRETQWDKPADFVENIEDSPEKQSPEKSKEEVIFLEKNNIISSQHDHHNNKFYDKTVTVVNDENKEISKLEQYSDIFRATTEYNFENTPYSPDAML